MILLGISFVCAVGWILYEIPTRELNMTSFIISWLAFTFAFVSNTFICSSILLMWVLFLFALSVGTLIIVHNDINEGGMY